MTILLAQAAAAQDSIWPAILRTIDNNGLWIFIGFCVLAGTAKHLVQRILEHQERLAMIQAGMRPDDEDQKFPKRHAG